MRHLTLLLAWLCLSIYLFAGCSGESESEGGDGQPMTTPAISGVWWGYLSSYADTNGEFIMGIITEECAVRLVTDTSQFAGPEGAWQVYPNTIQLTGVLSQYLYDDSTPLDHFDVTSFTWDYAGFTFGSTLIVDQIYEDEKGSLMLFYNTTYDKVPPKVANLSGVWHLENTTGFGDSVSLVVTPDLADTTSGAIHVKKGMLGNDTQTGTDILKNGTIEIHYSNNIPFNVYDVSLQTPDDDIVLTGLAAYVEEESTYGVTISKTMVVGTSGAPSNSPGTVKSFSGLATYYTTLAE